MTGTFGNSPSIVSAAATSAIGVGIYRLSADGRAGRESNRTIWEGGLIVTSRPPFRFPARIGAGPGRTSIRHSAPVHRRQPRNRCRGDVFVHRARPARPVRSRTRSKTAAKPWPPPMPMAPEHRPAVTCRRALRRHRIGLPCGRFRLPRSPRRSRIAPPPRDRHRHRRSRRRGRGLCPQRHRRRDRCGRGDRRPLRRLPAHRCRRLPRRRRPPDAARWRQKSPTACSSTRSSRYTGGRHRGAGRGRTSCAHAGCRRHSCSS